MAIFIEGMLCQICKHSMYVEQYLMSFSTFVPNQSNPIWMFNDGIFHEKCVEEHPEGKRAKRCYEQAQQANRDWPPLCFICGQTITNADNHFTSGHLTEDHTHPLFKYNYLHAHRRCLRYWSDLATVSLMLQELNASGKWSGPVLDLLIDDLLNQMMPNH